MDQVMIGADHIEEILTEADGDDDGGLVTVEYDDGDSLVTLLAADGDGDGTQVTLNRHGALQLMLALAAFVKQA